tara:strand:+ start:617 stop:832 length:216 start_codon:yes stop_codon:yes gene_type:complete
MKVEGLLKSMSWKHGVQFNGEGGVDVVSVFTAIEYANQRVIKELEEQLELAEHYNASEKLSERIYELKQER